MNDTFNLSRFWHLLLKDIRSAFNRNRTTLILFTFMPALCWLMALLSCILHGENFLHGEISPYSRWLVIWGMMSLTIVLTPSLFYPEVNRGKEGMHFALLPASKLEKYLSMILVCAVIYPAIVYVGNVLTDTLLWMLPFGPHKASLFSMGRYVGDLDSMSYETMRLAYAFTNPVFVFLNWLSSVALFLFTNTLFKRRKVVKTVAWSFLIGMVLSVTLIPMMVDGAFDGLFDRIEVWCMSRDEWTVASTLVWGLTALEFLWCAVLLWWTGRRLYKMKY